MTSSKLGTPNHEITPFLPHASCLGPVWQGWAACLAANQGMLLLLRVSVDLEHVFAANSNHLLCLNCSLEQCVWVLGTGPGGGFFVFLVVFQVSFCTFLLGLPHTQPGLGPGLIWWLESSLCQEDMATGTLRTSRV